MRTRGSFILLARWLLGGIFIYLGAAKVLEPLEFLKLVRQYDLVSGPALNLVAALVPWLEIFCGLLLVIGFAVRGTTVLVLLILVAFTAAVAVRAIALHDTGSVPFCSIRFDCGCGSGEVLICRKLAENLALMVLAGILFAAPTAATKRPGRAGLPGPPRSTSE